MSHSLTPFYYCATISNILAAICGYWQHITFIDGILKESTNKDFWDNEFYDRWFCYILSWAVGIQFFSGLYFLANFCPNSVKYAIAVSMYQEGPALLEYAGWCVCPPPLITTCQSILTWVLPGDASILLTLPGPSGLPGLWHQATSRRWTDRLLAIIETALGVMLIIDQKLRGSRLAYL